MADHNIHEQNEAPLGLALAQKGYQLTGVTAPEAIGEDGRLYLTVIGPDGDTVTEFEQNHEKELHLIVVRADGQYSRHVHPKRDEEGIWSISWRWNAAGTYRVFTDFVPVEIGEGLTLSTTLHVGGSFAPDRASSPLTEITVDEFAVTMTGDLIAGEASELTMNISRDGKPVTGLEPYLGAFGHLVALRDGDLSYLHVHPSGDEPVADERSGPNIVFEATAPTEGRYLLYLDFQVGGKVYTAPLVGDTISVSEGYDVSHTDKGD